MNLIKNYRSLLVLSIVLTALSAISAALGLFMPDLYHDNEFVKTAWYGNDWVTLGLVVPFLIIVLFFSRKGSAKIQLIWMGLISYLFYNYSFYLFGASFNNAFLLYTSIFSVSFFTLILGLSSISVQNIKNQSRQIRWISIYLFLIALMLCMVEISSSLLFITEGKIPEIMTMTQHPTNIVYALDLGLIVPAMFLSALWLWQHKSWGYGAFCRRVVDGKQKYGRGSDVTCLGIPVR